MKIGLITDIHEDYSSLQKALRKVAACECEQIVCLGDISGYSNHYKHPRSRDASACLNLIREHCSVIITGNHDLLSAERLPRINPEFVYPDNWYEMDATEQATLSEGKVWLYEDETPGINFTPADIVFLKTLPEYDFLETERGRILFSHYAYPNLTGSMSGFYDSRKTFLPHLDWMKQQQCRLSFIGHHHVDGVLLVNEKRYQYKHFTRKIDIKDKQLVVLPPLVKHRVPNRFCIFNTDTNKLEIKRI